MQNYKVLEAYGAYVVPELHDYLERYDHPVSHIPMYEDWARALLILAGKRYQDPKRGGYYFYDGVAEGLEMFFSRACERRRWYTSDDIKNIVALATLYTVPYEGTEERKKMLKSALDPDNDYYELLWEAPPTEEKTWEDNLIERVRNRLFVVWADICCANELERLTTPEEFKTIQLALSYLFYAD